MSNIELQPKLELHKTNHSGKKHHKRNRNKTIGHETTTPTSDSRLSGVVSDSPTGPNEPQQPLSEKDKLKEKIKALRSRRTGLERRQQLELQKQSEQQGKKPKSAVAPLLARETIHDLLGKFGIHDMKLENDVMNEISSGRIKTPQDVASHLVGRLTSMYPNGPRPPAAAAQTTPAAQPSSAAQPTPAAQPSSAAQTTPAAQPSSAAQTTPAASEQNTIAESAAPANSQNRKKLHPPTASLLK